MADRYSMLSNGFMHQAQMNQQHVNQGQDGLGAFNEQAPMWSQMQQIQNQFRPQSTGLDGNHVSPQVAEMMRNQQLARQAAASQQQHFPSFLDQQNNSFQNMPPSLNGRFQQPNNPDANRQLELLGIAHNQQQTQNGPVNFANRMHQQAALNGQRMGQPDSFLGPPAGNPMRQPSPSGQPQPPVPVVPGPQSQPAQVTRASYVALQERAHNLKSIISNQEAQLMQLTSQRTRIGDASFMDKVRTVSADLKNRKEHYARLVNFIGQIQSHMQHGGGQNMPMGAQMPVPAGGSWMQGNQPTGQPQFNQNQGPQPPQTNPATATPNNMPPNFARPGPSQPHPMQPTPPFPPNTGAQSSFALPPLDKLRFDNVFKSWCAQRNIQLNPRILTIDARSIDLHDLHTQVILEGGAQAVAQKDLWAVVGGRMGFVQFSGSDSEPAKSGPGVAQQLAHAYKEYLAAFDNVYLSTVMESRRKNQANLQHPMARAPTDPAQMQLVMQYANLPTSELRRRGMPEQVIQFVENHRATILQNRMDQAKFHEMLAPQQQQPGGGPPPNNNLALAGGAQPMRPPPNQLQPTRLMDASGQPPQRPTRESMQAAMVQLAKLKSEYGPERMLQNVPPIELPPDQRMEYNTVLEQLHRACMDLDHKLPMILAVLKNESVVRRYVIIVQTAIQQRAMITSGSTRFLVTLETLRNMLLQVQTITENFATILSTLMNKQQVPGGGPNGPLPITAPGPGPGPRPPMPGPMGPQMGGPQPPMPPQPMPPQPPVARPPINLQPPPKRRGTGAAPSPAPTTPAALTPTPPPVASASTPVHNAPTPRDMASPKSPKTKGAAKPKPAARRRQSVAKQTAAPAPPADPMTVPSPAGSKRAREEDPSPSLQSSIPSQTVANEPSPPKRLKMEWDGPPSEAVAARAEQVENVKTEEDSAVFLEQMTELFKMANDGQDRLTSDFSDTLDSILKGFGTSTDESTLPTLGLGESSLSDVVPPSNDDFVEFFDFSSFGAGEEDDTAPTPDLISSSANPSTNPSPESNAEIDAAHQAPALLNETKPEELDPLRLGAWKEVDGGESAYFNSGQWKWDSAMQHLEQPWAIYTS
uniref:ARID domain-containing protein n=1 Tax=Mycena chlorophos TaxID=658473 RepID=A0ABQ0MC63_MYCCL|nr:predicted protein [Mycena chlorophos]